MARSETKRRVAVIGGCEGRVSAGKMERLQDGWMVGMVVHE